MRSKSKIANPAPLGLYGFGLTTIALSIFNAGVDGPFLGSVICFALFFGGLAQVIAGILDFIRGSLFGATAFTSYGFFWIATATFIFIFPSLGWGTPTGLATGVYLALWGLFTLAMAACTFRMNRALQILFITLTILFFTLAIADIAGIAALKIAGGYLGIYVGLNAFYVATAEILNEMSEKIVLPLG